VTAAELVACLPAHRWRGQARRSSSRARARHHRSGAQWTMADRGWWIGRCAAVVDQAVLAHTMRVLFDAVATDRGAVSPGVEEVEGTILERVGTFKPRPG